MSSPLDQLREAYLRDNYVILDTETTGLHVGQIIQIAVIDKTGNAYFDLLLKPTGSIPSDAAAIHGITDDMVEDATTWPIFAPSLLNYLSGKDVIIYNAKYDRNLMHQSAEAYQMPKIDWKAHANFICAMEAYSEFSGDWNDYHSSYPWLPLTKAVRQQGLNPNLYQAHSALGDCLMTLELVKAMCNVEAKS